MRETLLKLFQTALRAVDGEIVTRESVGSGEYALVALGKAASAMARGALQAPGVNIVQGFVCAPKGYGRFTPPGRGHWEVYYTAHPIPDASSLAAGDALVDWLHALPAGLPLLVLMSGGSSACIEKLRDGMSLREVATRTRTLLNSGADIRVMNAARSEWSLLKNGRALKEAGLRDIHVRVIADVQGDDPALVGSGPFFGHAPNLDIRVIAANRRAVAGVVESAHAAGLTMGEGGSLGGDAARQGALIAGRLLQAEPGVYIWGGEPTVALPEPAGRGGRCQHLALAAAIELAGKDRVALLAAGTDGVDGNSTDAGALVDGGTVARMREQGVDALAALKSANSNSALAASGDLIHTGATGTNVMDLVIGIVTP